MPYIENSYGYGPEPLRDRSANDVGSLWYDTSRESDRSRRMERLKRLGYLNAGTPYGPQTDWSDARRASRSAIAIRKLQELRDEAETDVPTSGLEVLGRAVEPVGDALAPVPGWLADQAPELRPPRVFGQEIF